MSSPVDQHLACARSVLFQQHGTAGVYESADGESTITVILSEEEDRMQEDGAARVRERQRVIQVRTADIAQPRRGDLFTLTVGEEEIVYTLDQVLSVGNGLCRGLFKRPEKQEAAGRRR